MPLELLELRGAVSLTSVPGVGARTAGRLVAFFGSESEALRALAWCRVSLVEEAVGRAAAVRMVHGLYRLAYGSWPRDVAASDEAWELFLAARRVVEERAVTRPGRDVISCYLPSPSPGSSERRSELLRAYAEAVKLVPAVDEAVRAAGDLDWPRPIKPPKLKRLLVVVGDRDAYERARRDLSGYLDVAYAEDPGDVEAVAEGRDDVVVYDPYQVYRGPYATVAELTVEEVAPEAVVEQFRANWRVLKSLSTFIDTVGAEGAARLASLYGLELDPSDLERLKWLARVLEGGDVAEAVDAEYARLRRAFARLDAVLDDVEAWVNEVLREELERLEVRIPASKLLEVLASLQRGEPPSIELPEELYEVFTRVAEEAERRIVDELELEADEAELVRGVVPRAPAYPLALDRRPVAELRALLASKLGSRRLHVLRTIAERARGLRSVMDALVQLVAVLDAGRACHQLEARGLASYAHLVADALGVGFREALEAALLERMVRGDASVQRVSYIVGRVPAEPNPTRGERVVLLTGANSGGKTTLLKTIAQVVLMAQSGLPVFAREAWVAPFDRVYFLSKPQGEVGAGALEQMVRTLARIATSEGRRLVLVDELEAATEAGAAARLLAGFIEYLAAQEDVVAVVVTHLASEVLAALPEAVRGSVRVDGIEAVGLDDNYNLIVDRNPHYYVLARSTPELVVKKLAKTAKRRGEKQFYERLLSLLSGSASPRGS